MINEKGEEQLSCSVNRSILDVTTVVTHSVLPIASDSQRNERNKSVSRHLKHTSFRWH